MRVAVVTPYFPVSGELFRGQSAYQTIRQLQRWAEVEVFCPLVRYPSWFRPRSFPYTRPDLTWSPEDVVTHYFEYPALPGISRPVNGAVCAHFLEPHLRKAGADVVLNYWIYPEGYAAVSVSRRLGIPVILGALGSDLNRIPDPISGWLTRRALVNADYLITVSAHLREQAIALGAAPERVRAVRNGCDGAIFRPRERAPARAELGLSPDCEVILYVGRLDFRKGVLELFTATQALLARKPNLQLIYLGDGPSRDELERRVREGRMSDKVRLEGKCSAPQVAQWMAACDLLALPSYAEGCPNVVVEALNCGRAVVASNVGGIPELVDESCGILIPPRDAGALAAALDRALAIPWNAAAIASQNQRTWEQVARETYEVCELVRSRKAERRCPESPHAHGAMSSRQ